MAKSNDNFLPDGPPHRDLPGAVTRSRRLDASGASAASGRQVRHNPIVAESSSPHVDPRDPEGFKEDPWIRYGDNVSSGQELPTGKCWIIGIDYGATFSEVAYILVDHALFRLQCLPESLLNNVEILCDYDEAAQFDLHYEVPTVLTYHRSGSNPRPLRWGFSACLTRKVQEHHCEKAELAKFLFSNQHDNLQKVKSLRSLAKRLNKQPFEFAADFLRKLNAKLQTEMKEAYPDDFDAPKYYYCGVPAGWNDEKAIMTDACYKAGLWGTTLVSESEAAANTLLSKRASRLKAGDVLLVLDVGGMTGDTAVYEVIRTNPPLTRAVTCGNGLDCGSAFINERFRKWLTSKCRRLISDQELRGRWIDNQVFEFEKYKKSYDGNSKEPILFPLYEKLVPGWSAVSESSVELTNKTMKALFDPVINEVIKLASMEIKKCNGLGYPADRMLLSGGFSSNQYYWNRIQAAFSKSRLVIEKPNRWNVNVSKGIVATALNQSTVTERRSRFSVGMPLIQDYDKDVHGKRKHLKTFRDCHEGNEIVESIQWLLGKNDPIPTAKSPIRASREYTIPTNGEVSWRFRDEIIVSRGEAFPGLSRIPKGSKPGESGMYDLRDGCFSEDPFYIDLRDLSRSKRRSLLTKNPDRRGTALSLFHEIVFFLDKGNWIFQFIPTADRSIVREHRYRGDNFYAMQTEIGTLIPHVAESTAQDTDVDEDDDDDDEFGAGQDNDLEEEDYKNDPTLSAVQQGKRPARAMRSRQSATKPEEQITPPPPAIRSLGENRGQKDPPTRSSARKRGRAERDTVRSEADKVGNKKRNTSLSVMDQLRHSYPDEELFAK